MASNQWAEIEVDYLTDHPCKIERKDFEPENS